MSDGFVDRQREIPIMKVGLVTKIEDYAKYRRV